MQGPHEKKTPAQVRRHMRISYPDLESNPNTSSIKPVSAKIRFTVLIIIFVLVDFRQWSIIFHPSLTMLLMKNIAPRMTPVALKPIAAKNAHRMPQRALAGSLLA